MNVRGRHRADKDPCSNFLYNRFEGLEVENTNEEEEWEEEEEVTNEKRKKIRANKKKSKPLLQAIPEQNEKEDSPDSSSHKESKPGLKSEESDDTKNSETSEISDINSNSDIEIETLVNVAQISQLKPSKLLTVDLKIQNSNFQGILDTGSDSNMIRKSIIKDTGFKIHTNRKIVFKGLGEDEQQTIGKVWLPFSFFGVGMENTPFEVVEDNVISAPIILGRKFIALKKITIDPANDRISLPTSMSSKVDIYQDPNDENRTIIYESLKVYCTKTTAVGKYLTKVPISYNYYENIKLESKTKMYFEGNCCNKRLEGVDGIMELEGEDKFIFMKRKDGENVDKQKVRKGDVVGHISSIVEVEDEEDTKDSDWDMNKLKNKIDIGKEVTEEQKEQIYNMLLRTKSALSNNDTDIGKAKVTPHKIVLTNNTPIWQKPRRFSDPVNDEIERQCKELESMDIIEKSNSPWSSPIVPIRKYDGSLRLCIDYRKVNAVTRPEKFPMPNLYDSIYSAHNIKYFTKIDLVKGYYQIPIDEESRPLTSFSTQNNQYQFKRLSFGLRNSGIQFQRNMHEILSDFHSKKVIVYIDDIMIISETFEEQLETVEKVLNTLMKNGIKIKVSKCEFFKEEVSFLGHVINKEGIRKCPSYIEKVQNFPKPVNVNQLRRFLGLVNFQRKFVNNLSVIAKPLSKLTNGPKRKTLHWTEEMEIAFEQIKEKLVEEVTLSFPDYTSDADPLELYVDASGIGAGACLMQKQNGEYKTIAYSSTAFSETEQNYSTIERELLALRWGVKNFRTFLFGINFTIYTDHRPLLYLHNMSRDNARLTRTLNELEDYDFTIKYRPGSENEAADTLSRIVAPPEGLDRKVVEGELPEGLRVSEKIEGGGDSMFKALMIVLEYLNATTEDFELPENHQELREKLVTHLANNHSKLKIQLDRQRLKLLKAMRHPGVLPCEEILMAVCDLYKVEIQVHHGMKWPVVYKTNETSESTKSIHLQCLSGIHFNPVVSRKNVKVPMKDKLINVIHTKNIEENHEAIDDTEGYEEDGVRVMVLTHRALCKCIHKKEESECTSVVSVGNSKFCALLDTGAQVSLITENVFKQLKQENPELPFDELDETLVGVGNQKNKVIGITELKLKILNSEVESTVPFAIVKTECLPWCALLGLNFLKINKVILDFENLLTIYEGDKGSPIEYPMMTNNDKTEEATIFQGIVERESTLEYKQDDNQESSDEPEYNKKLRYSIDNNLPSIQESDHAIASLKRNIEKGARDYREPFLKQFKRYNPDLYIDTDILYKKHKNQDLTVLPFSIMVDVAVKTHEQLSHIGCNKLSNLISNQFWHPAIENICRDVCRACIHCQFYKVHSQHLKPPTLKIETGHPFEIVAVDVMLLPKTPKGNQAVVVAVDHHSKWLTAVPIKNKTSATVTNVLRNNILPNLPRIPDKILSDNGPEFRASTFQEMLNEYNIKHVFSTPYKPSSNGCVERANRTVIQLLKGLIGSKANSWDEHLSKALITYNTTIHAEIKTSPSEFLLQRSHEYSQTIPISKDTLKTWKPGNPKFLPFTVGQKVLKKVQRTGNLVANKLEPRYEGPFEVVKTRPNEVTYELKPIGDENSSVIRAHYEQLKVFIEIPEYLKKYVEFKPTKVSKERSSNSQIPVGRVPTFGNSDTESSETESEDDQMAVLNTTVKHNERSTYENRKYNQKECSDATLNWSSLDNFIERFMKKIRNEDEEDKHTAVDNVDLDKLHCSEPVIHVAADYAEILSSTPNIHTAPKFCQSTQVSPIQLHNSKSTSTFDSIDKMIINAPIASSNSQESGNRSSSLKTICEHILKKNDNTKFEAFVELMDEAWSVSNQMLDLEISKTEEQISKSKSKTIASDTSESFEGFDQCPPTEPIGSARLNFLRAMKTHSSEYKDLTVEFKSGRDNRLKAVWDKKMRSSVFRLCPSISFSDSESSNVRSPLERMQTMTTRLHAMRTRSQGKTSEMPNVQTKTLEYNRKS